MGLVTDAEDTFTRWPAGGTSSTPITGDGPDWMSVDAAVVYPRTLAQLTLPGTHDSGAYRLTKQLMPDRRFPTPWAAAAIALAERLHVPVDRVITPWALTQTMDVAAQLRAGYRYVDLRAGWNGTHWCAHHAEVGTPVRTVLRDVAGFVATHPGEVVVVQVSHLDGFPTDDEVRALATTIGEELLGVLVPLPPHRAITHPADGVAAPHGGGGGGGGGGVYGQTVRGGGGGVDNGTAAPSLDRTVGEMVESGERVLVTFGDGDYRASHSGAVYPFSHLWPPWTLHNTYANTDNPAAMVHYNREQVAAFGGGAGQRGWRGRLVKVSWTLTTQTSTVLESVLPSHPKSLRELNALGEPLLAPFAEEVVAAGCRSGNILTVDFAATSHAVRAARAMNALPLSVNCTLQPNPDISIAAPA